MASSVRFMFIRQMMASAIGGGDSTPCRQNLAKGRQRGMPLTLPFERGNSGPTVRGKQGECDGEGKVSAAKLDERVRQSIRRLWPPVLQVNVSDPRCKFCQGGFERFPCDLPRL